MQMPAGYTVMHQAMQPQPFRASEQAAPLCGRPVAFYGNCAPHPMQAWNHAAACLDRRARSASPPPSAAIVRAPDHHHQPPPAKPPPAAATVCAPDFQETLYCKPPGNMQLQAARPDGVMRMAVQLSPSPGAVAPARVAIAMNQSPASFVVQPAYAEWQKAANAQAVVRQASMEQKIMVQMQHAEEVSATRLGDALPDDSQLRSSNVRSKSADCKAADKQDKFRSRRASLHNTLYEDAFARKMRLQNLTAQYDHARDCEEKQQFMQHKEGMKPRRRNTRPKDMRTHLEREEDHVRKIKELRQRNEADKLERQQRELEHCTFKPLLGKRGEVQAGQIARTAETGPSELAKLTESFHGGCDEKASAKVKELADRQRAALESLRLLEAENAHVQKRLRATHTELSRNIKLDENDRVVSLLRDFSARCEKQWNNGKGQKMVTTREKEQMFLVEELEDQSREEMQRRISEAFQPIQIEMEGELYLRHLAVMHELELVEAQALALGGVSFATNSNWLGLELGVADRVRRSLTIAPGTANLHSSGDMFPSRSNDEIHTPRTFPSVSGCLPKNERSSAMGASLAFLDALGKMTKDSSENRDATCSISALP